MCAMGGLNLSTGRTGVKKVYVFEEKCCGLSVAEPLVNFLKAELNEPADVRAFDLSHPKELVPLPPSLFFKLMSEGSKCLPAMVVDSVLMTEGWLPAPTEALGIVVSGRPPNRTDVAAATVTGSHGCCEPCSPNSSSCCSSADGNVPPAVQVTRW